MFRAQYIESSPGKGLHACQWNMSRGYQSYKLKHDYLHYFYVGSCPLLIFGWKTPSRMQQPLFNTFLDFQAENLSRDKYCVRSLFLLYLRIHFYLVGITLRYRWSFLILFLFFQAVLADITTVKVVPLLQLSLFSKWSQRPWTYTQLIYMHANTRVEVHLNFFIFLISFTHIYHIPPTWIGGKLFFFLFLSCSWLLLYNTSGSQINIRPVTCNITIM